ncbi:MAG: geranylgeranyl reductase family protein [Chitinivibrionales bacterium]|nr:geranylgeranyl reductase family protein [Chitinivibrionales bacterium]MBD3357458.1 geranylgeranyl reductase family protein [Chitinivibrionales bacterium]
MGAEAYDIVVIGAGPAGLCAARHLLSRSSRPSVLLLDKTEPWREPVACAEGVGRLSLLETIHPEDSWIRLVVDTAVFHSPDGTVVTYHDANKGYIINRALMHRDLALWCEEHGAVNRFGNGVTEVSLPDRAGRRRVTLEDGSSVRSGLVIDASGPLSRLGGTEGIDWKADDLEPALFAHVEGVDLKTSAVHIYVGKETAPGGYAWAFPRDEKSFNVGIVIGSAYKGKVNIRRLLDKFLANTFGALKVRGMYAGSIPCTSANKRTTAIPGLIRAGDAAGTVNPVSRAGIAEAMLSGVAAGRSALAMLGTATDRERARICARHEKDWAQRRGKRHRKLAKVKGALVRVPDADYNRAAHALSGISQDELTMSRIFTAALGRFPRLAWAMRHLM